MLQSIDYSLQLGNVPPGMLPEYQLWLAVIDRAIVDYINWQSRLNAKEKGYLEWFLFETESVPHNLTYLSDMLFDYNSAAKEIRERVLRMKGQVKRTGNSNEYRGRYRRKLNRSL